MRVLWISNILFPDLSKELGSVSPNIGGWMYSSAKRLSQCKNIELAIACTSNITKDFVNVEINSIKYFVIPLHFKNKDKTHVYIQKYWSRINEIFNPDIVHLHGTEYAHGLDYIKACGSENLIVSIQGMPSVYARYYYAGLKESLMSKYFSLIELLRCNTISRQRILFEKKGKNEIEILRSVSHVIGRTSWDKDNVWAINPHAHYHFCSETMREVFYTKKWDYEKCEKHTIFLSQGQYPIKGLHIMLYALQIILRFYPDTMLYVAGQDITNIKSWYRRTGYGKYIKKIIKKLNLDNHVIFTGPLTEFQICDRFLKSNLFVCPSSIENSPNSLGEAQLLGIPYLTSYVGGVMDLVGTNYNSLYRFEEYATLAKKVCEIFSQTSFNCKESDTLWRYDPIKNINDLLKIYRDVLNSKNN